MRHKSAPACFRRTRAGSSLNSSRFCMKSGASQNKRQPREIKQYKHLLSDYLKVVYEKRLWSFIFVIFFPEFPLSSSMTSTSITKIRGVVIVTQVIPQDQAYIPLQNAALVEQATPSAPPDPPAVRQATPSAPTKLDEITASFLQGQPQGLGVRWSFPRSLLWDLCGERTLVDLCHPSIIHLPSSIIAPSVYHPSSSVYCPPSPLHHPSVSNKLKLMLLSPHFSNKVSFSNELQL